MIHIILFISLFIFVITSLVRSHQCQWNKSEEYGSNRLLTTQEQKTKRKPSAPPFTPLLTYNQLLNDIDEFVKLISITDNRIAVWNKIMIYESFNTRAPIQYKDDILPV